MQLTIRSWRFPDLSSRSIAVRFEAAGALHELAEMVKVFGCREAYENRPSTIPRVRGGELWRFRLLSRCADAVTFAVKPMGVPPGVGGIVQQARLRALAAADPAG